MHGGRIVGHDNIESLVERDVFKLVLSIVRNACFTASHVRFVEHQGGNISDAISVQSLTLTDYGQLTYLVSISNLNGTILLNCKG